MNNIELSLTEVKNIQMDVLSAIDDFCKCNDIKYSLGEGTLLGAVRHRGYIPWDDDIDIVLLRSEYNRLISEFPKVYKGHFKIASLERNEEWIRPYAVAYDDDTLLIEAGREKMSIGVKIDIFPVDNIPSDINVKSFFDTIRPWMVYHNLCGAVKGSSFFKTICLKLIYFTTVFYSRRKQAQHIQRLLCKYNSQDSDRLFEWTMYKHSISIFPKAVFNEYKYYPFEDRYYMGMVNADEYLTSLYGDYMQLPPEEDRKPHHAYKAYLK